MRLTPLPPQHPNAIHDALVRRGMDTVRARAVADGLRPVAVLVDDLSAGDRDVLAAATFERQVECLTGDGWALVAGSVTGLAALVRPGASALPGPLAEGIGRALTGLSATGEAWRTARGTVALSRPVVAGILNVTPDSFSDGGRHREPEAAVRHAEAMLEAGADLVDVGAESTRPGRPEAVPVEDEWRRLEPVLEGLRGLGPGVPISVDTVKATVAERALDAGAWIVNDVSGLRLDPRMAEVCARAGAGLVLMHSRGRVEDMASYDHAAYEDTAGEIRSELAAALARATAAGVALERIAIDPGLGFAKRPEDNYAALNRLDAVTSLGCPVMVGPSRKRFLGRDLPDEAARDRATAAACVAAYDRGAILFRVHAVAPVRQALDIAYRVRSG